MSILQNAISTWREGKIIKPVRRYVLFPFWKVGMNQNDVHETVLFQTAICLHLHIRPCLKRGIY